MLKLPPATAWAARTQTLTVQGSTDGTTFTTGREPPSDSGRRPSPTGPRPVTTTGRGPVRPATRLRAAAGQERRAGACPAEEDLLAVLRGVAGLAASALGSGGRIYSWSY